MNLLEAISTIESIFSAETKVTEVLNPLLGKPDVSYAHSSAEWNFKAKRGKTIYKVSVYKSHKGYALDVFSMPVGGRIGQEKTLAEFYDMSLDQIVSRVKVMMRKHKIIKKANSVRINAVHKAATK